MTKPAYRTERVGKMTREEYAAFRADFPFYARMSEIVGRPHANKHQVKQCRDFFAGMGATVVVNTNTCYFKNAEDGVFFRLGMWIS